MDKKEILKNKRILITRPLHQSGALAQELQKYGAEIIVVPLLQILPPDSWHDFDEAMNNLSNYQWLLFASSNAVESTIERAKSLGVSSVLESKKIACIGSSTADCLHENGLEAHFQPTRFVADSFAEEFCGATASETKKSILWLRTSIGRKLLKEELEKSGWQVKIVHSYKSAGPEDPEQTANLILDFLSRKEIDVITFGSSQTARNLKEILDKSTGTGSQNISKLLARVKFAAIGPETGKTCRELFGRLEIESAIHTMPALAKSIADHFREFA